MSDDGVFDSSKPLSQSSDEERDLSIVIPTKPTYSIKLPPVETEENPRLVVNKRRKLQLVAIDGAESETNKIIPTKSRAGSVSTCNRVQSLNDIAKPELTPPNSNLSYQSFEKEWQDDGEFESTPTSKRICSSPSRLRSMASSNLCGHNQTPDFSSRREESKLDTQIRELNKKLETLKRAKSILNKKHSADNEELIDKWRTAAQQASNYLLNAAIERVNKAGGKQEFVRKEQERMKEAIEFSVENSFHDRVAEITQSEEYETLPEVEQEQILKDLEEQQQKAIEQAESSLIIQDGNEEIESEFTMKDLYKRLKLDHKLVFPDNDD